MKLAVIIEGVDCSGKSTVVRMLKEELCRLHSVYVNNILTHECSWMRDMMLSGKYVFSDVTKSTLFTTSFIRDLERIEQATDDDTIVIFDRFIASTYAYNTKCDLMDVVAEKLKDVPVLQIYLDVGKDTLTRRLAAKENKDAHERDEQYIFDVHSRYNAALLFTSRIMGKNCDTFFLSNDDNVDVSVTVRKILDLIELSLYWRQNHV